MDALTVEDFNSLGVGDLVEVGQLMPGLSDEPITLHTSKREGDVITFTATWFGVTLGLLTCTNKEGVLEWTTW